MHFLDYLVLAGYFFLLIGIGIYSARRVKQQEDYFMGGRSFGKLLQTFAAFGAGTGSSDPVNTGRTTYTSGMSGMWSVMYWLFVTPFYWITGVWYRRMRHLTLGDWFVERYESKAMGVGYCIYGLLFFMLYGSMLFSAIGKVAAPLVGVDAFQLGGQTYGIEYLLVPVIGFVVLVYGLAGGLRAAYFTDLVQGICIIMLSILLVPFGLEQLVEKFGDPSRDGLMSGFRLLHEQLPSESFEVIGSSRASEFPLHRIMAVVLINLIGIVVQPHFIATGGGSAKTEMNARVGLVVGNFLKRFCTIGWVLTALIAVALYADLPELVEDPDKTWGVASRELLGPGLRGLMLACLLAALMSSIDAYMIVGSALLVRNFYAPLINANATEREYVRLGRMTGFLVVLGAVVISLFIMDVFQQLQLTWVFPVLFAAPFWIGMYWRRATTWAAALTVLYCAAFFFLIPWLAPKAWPELRGYPALTRTNHVVTTYASRQARQSDVARNRAAIALWDQRRESVQEARDEVTRLRDALAPLDSADPAEDAESTFDPVALEALSNAVQELAEAEARLQELGERPDSIEPAELIYDTAASGGQFIFWASGDKTGSPETIRREYSNDEYIVTMERREDDETFDVEVYRRSIDGDRGPRLESPPSNLNEMVRRAETGPEAFTQPGELLVITQRDTGEARGTGNLKLDLLLFQWLGMDLTRRSNATLATLELPAKIVTPFLVMIVLSLITPANSKEALDRYYAKMKTPVSPDPDEDRQRLDQARAHPELLEKKKLFPGTRLEFQKPTAVDIIGFLISLAVCFGVIALAVWITQIGA